MHASKTELRAFSSTQERDVYAKAKTACRVWRSFNPSSNVDVERVIRPFEGIELFCVVLRNVTLEDKVLIDDLLLANNENNFLVEYKINEASRFTS